MYKFIKRFIDIFCALLGIIGTSPVWIFSIVATEISDWGPLFYFANRVGKDNKVFKMYKLPEGFLLRTSAMHKRAWHCTRFVVGSAQCEWHVVRASRRYVPTRTASSGGAKLCEG